jgi:hypothetical protein
MCESINKRSEEVPEVNGPTPCPDEAEKGLTIGKIIDAVSVGDWLKLGGLAMTVVLASYTAGKWDRSGRIEELEIKLRAAAVIEEFHVLYMRLILTDEADEAEAVQDFVAFIDKYSKVQPDGSAAFINIKRCPKTADTKLELPDKTVYPIPAAALIELKRRNLAGSRPLPGVESLVPGPAGWAVEGWLMGEGAGLRTANTLR